MIERHLNYSIYMDESKPLKNSFDINVLISGVSEACEDFEKRVKSIVTKYRKDLGSTFNGFHANKLKPKNWHKLSPAFFALLEYFSDCIKQNCFRVVMHVESKEKKEKNSGYIKKMFQEALTTPGNKFYDVIATPDEKTKKMIYNSAVHFTEYTRLKHLLVPTGRNISFFPDEVGAIARHKKSGVFMSNSSGEFLRRKLFQCLTTVGNNLPKAIEEAYLQEGIEDQYCNCCHDLVSFCPTKDQDSSLIQVADIMANFLLASFRRKVGAALEIDEKKAEVFDALKFYDEDKIEPITNKLRVIKVDSSLRKNGKEVGCDKDLDGKWKINTSLNQCCPIK